MANESGARIGPLVFKPAADAQRPISAEIVDQAVDWLVKMQSGGASAADSDACNRWRQSHPDHERAWLRVCGIGRDLREGTNAVTAHVARAALRGTDRQQRRWALKAVAGLGIGAWAAWAMRHDIALLSADYRTAAGERRDLVLPDGTRVVLNTRSAIDVCFDPTARTLRLLGGEIMVTTAKDAAQRPFVVLGRDGRIVPVGTRFLVREYDLEERHTEVTVLEGAVDVSTSDSSQPTRVPAGSRVHFGSAGVGRPSALATGAAAWTDGMLVVERMRLDDFVAELARYRSGVLRCDPAVAGVLVSGAFPLADTDAVLSMLGETLPVRVRSLSRYWVTVAAR